MPSTPRDLNDHWFAHLVHSVDAATERAAGEPVTFSQSASLGRFITPDVIANPGEVVEARDKMQRHLSGIFEVIKGVKRGE